MRALAEIRQALTGPMPSFSTPFRQDGGIDYAAAAGMVDFYVSSGAKAIMLTAGDSHYACLSDREIAELTCFVLKQAAGRVFVIAADRSFNTSEALEFAEMVRARGADLLMLMPPVWGGSVTAESLATHYAEVGRIMPVMIVSNIFISNPALGLQAIRRALELSENVVAVKDDVCGAFGRKLGMEFQPYTALVSGGQKQNHLDACPYGFAGYLSTFMRFCPAVARRYWERIEAGDLIGAAEIVKQIDSPFFELIATFEGGFDSGIHGALELFGLAGRWRRKPYADIGDSNLDKLRDFFRLQRLL